ncbi:hypothetical protein U27_01777 [Candidatus Vecturithrix granuli]|uniref:Uncharacterized protein n=1 Tax=Vecturithrix granuli TaxID=1499967 RepID=A0A0S6W942_VECG1|nr:hypothetical protein U27_01777 [Candidatus Vecturithrix granuli]
MHDEERRKYFAMLIADIIQDLLRDSDELSEILETASKEGYDIFLTIFSGIMIRERDDEEKSAPLPPKFEFTQFDKEFLQSIGVRLPDEEKST